MELVSFSGSETALERRLHVAIVTGPLQRGEEFFLRGGPLCT